MTKTIRDLSIEAFCDYGFIKNKTIYSIQNENIMVSLKFTKAYNETVIQYNFSFKPIHEKFQYLSNIFDGYDCILLPVLYNSKCNSTLESMDPDEVYEEVTWMLDYYIQPLLEKPVERILESKFIPGITNNTTKYVLTKYFMEKLNIKEDTNRIINNLKNKVFLLTLNDFEIKEILPKHVPVEKIINKHLLNPEVNDFILYKSTQREIRNYRKVEFIDGITEDIFLVVRDLHNCLIDLSLMVESDQLHSSRKMMINDRMRQLASTLCFELDIKTNIHSFGTYS